MAKYVYPAIFTPESGGGYSINFPDLESCYTCSDSLEDGLEMAKDVLALTLYRYEKDSKPIPTPSDIKSCVLTLGGFANYIFCDTTEYRKMYNNKAVKKTLTIPEWINESAMSMGINFSQVLQEALLDKIHARYMQHCVNPGGIRICKDGPISYLNKTSIQLYLHLILVVVRIIKHRDTFKSTRSCTPYCISSYHAPLPRRLLCFRSSPSMPAISDTRT